MTRLATDHQKLEAIETCPDPRCVPELVAEIRRLWELVEVARRMHEVRLQYDVALNELKAIEKEKAEVEDEFSRIISSSCL